jgi:anti-sigma regulatory factor (Ser/Thr protein kinase)
MNCLVKPIYTYEPEGYTLRFDPVLQTPWSKDPFHVLFYKEMNELNFKKLDQLQDEWEEMVGKLCSSWNCKTKKDDISLCCREAVMNALTHGFVGVAKEDRLSTLEIACHETKGYVRVRVEDPGSGHQFDLQKRMMELDTLRSGQFGLVMMYYLSNWFEIQRGGSRVILGFKLSQS